MHSSCALMETSLRHRAVGCLPEHGEVMFSLAKTAEGLTDRLRAPSLKSHESLLMNLCAGVVEGEDPVIGVAVLGGEDVGTVLAQTDAVAVAVGRDRELVG